MNMRQQMTLPNVLTFIRIVLTPVMVLLILETKGEGIQTVFFFLLMWLTDILDGWIAKTFQRTTDFGKVLDPFADKVFSTSVAFALFSVSRLPLWFPVFFLIKDTLLILGGLFLWKRQALLSSAWQGKLSSFLLVLTLFIVLIFPERLFSLIPYFLLGSVILSFLTFLSYLFSVWASWKTGSLSKEEANFRKDQGVKMEIKK